jgi:D-alanine-D-alanine ligase
VTVATGAELADEIERRTPSLGGIAFAEEYVHGREFNVSLLEVDGAPVVLPRAEILFENYAPGRPRVVGYGAKWDTGSDEYRDTPRSFDAEPEDAALSLRLDDLALGCWELFGLGGYARVDFRVDESGAPFVLEVNANPCLAPDAGFVAAAARAGRPFAEVMDALIAAAQRRFAH